MPGAGVCLKFCLMGYCKKSLARGGGSISGSISVPGEISLSHRRVLWWSNTELPGDRQLLGKVSPLRHKTGPGPAAVHRALAGAEPADSAAADHAAGRLVATHPLAFGLDRAPQHKRDQMPEKPGAENHPSCRTSMR